MDPVDGLLVTHALLDAAPAGYRGRIVSAALKINGVIEVERARIRRAGNRYFADLSVGVARNVTFQRSEQMAEAVTSAVHEVLPDADVVVLRASCRAHREYFRSRPRRGHPPISMCMMSAQDFQGRLHVEQHLELDENLSLKEAHDRVTVLESEIRQDVPEIRPYSLTSRASRHHRSRRRACTTLAGTALEGCRCQISRDPGHA